jgi:hypothetical protein
VNIFQSDLYTIQQVPVADKKPYLYIPAAGRPNPDTGLPIDTISLGIPSNNCPFISGRQTCIEVTYGTLEREAPTILALTMSGITTQDILQLSNNLIFEEWFV